MTQNEISRLSIVETKINDMIEGQVTLKEFLIEQIKAQEKAIGIAMVGQKEAIGIAMVASEKAIVKAEIANDLRFEEMNKRISDYVESTDKNIKILTETKDMNAGAKTGVTESKVDLTRYLGWIVSILSIAAVIATALLR